MLSLRYWSLSQSVPINRNIIFTFGERIKPHPRRRFYYSSSPLRRICRSISSCTASFSLNEKVYADDNKQPSSFSNNSPISGVKDDLMGYISGKKKATEVAHSIWKQIVQKGDTVVDATCGNGYDTLAMLKMVANESGTGCVYGFDIQGEALESTSSLLDENANPQERGLVKLFNICHSNMEKVVSERTSVRLVAFNLGYLPGGDKTVITMSNTTLLALEAAKRIVTPGGLISLVVYIGHPGGREELETVEVFANKLSVDDWICCKFQMLNRPLAPVLVFLFKRDILV